MFSRRKLFLVAGLVLVIFGSGVSPARANNLAPYKTVYNTDVAVFGLGGMRNLGTGSIAVTGIVGTVKSVLLYWHGPTNNADPTSNAAVSFAGSPITGTNIGTSSDNCWGMTNSQAYRADVTSLVSGNGTYALANFEHPSAVGGAARVNGASLVVFYDDGNPNNNRDFVMFDGNDSNHVNTYDAPGWDVTLAGINYTSGAVNLNMIVSDGQTFGDAPLVLNSTTIAAGPNVFQGDTVPSAGTNLSGLLWDIKSYVITPQMTPGPNTLHLTTGYVSDCLSLIVAAVNLPAGAAPNQPTTTTTSTSTTTTTAPTTTTTAVVLPVAVPVAARPSFTG